MFPSTIICVRSNISQQYEGKHHSYNFLNLLQLINFQKFGLLVAALLVFIALTFVFVGTVKKVQTDAKVFFSRTQTVL